MTFPGGIRTWIPLIDQNLGLGILGDEIVAEDHNSAYDEITAIETALGVNLSNMILASGANAFAGNQSHGGFNITNVGTLDIVSMATDWTNAGRTIADLGIVSTVDINGGSIDGTPIGANVLSTIAGSTLDITGVATPTLSTTQQSVLELHRDVDAGFIDLVFQADNDGGAIIKYVTLSAAIVDNQAGTEDARLDINMVRSGVEDTNLIQISKTLFQFNTAGQNVDYQIRSNDDDNMFWLDGGNNAITIGSTTELAKLGIDGNADEVQFNAQAHSTQTNMLAQFTDSSNNIMFGIEGDGDIRTSRANTGTTGVGSITASLEIFDAAGASLGYIPIYDSVS